MSAMKTMAIAAAMVASQAALAGPAPPQQGPLAPGRAAGVANAQLNSSEENHLALLGALGLGAVGLYLVVGTNYHNPESHKSKPASGTK